MAVYTNITDEDVKSLLLSYQIGDFVRIEGIESGVVNSNFHLFTSKGRYILTIYEQVAGGSLDELPYFFHLKNHLVSNGINCPSVIVDNKSRFLNHIKDKPCAIVNFLSGKAVTQIENCHLRQLGENIAKMHIASNGFNLKRDNDFSIERSQQIFNQVQGDINQIQPNLANDLKLFIQELKDSWPVDLPKSVIHGDLFPDNVFFANKKLVGLIDFYFACDDFCMYDLAICLNAWCFEHHEEFNVTKARNLLSAYNKVRKITPQELEYLPILAKGAALRFLLTRIYDWVNHDKNALVKAKDPSEYLKRFKFHKDIKSYKQYGI